MLFPAVNQTCIRWICHHCGNLLKERRSAPVFVEELGTISGGPVNTEYLPLTSGLQGATEAYRCPGFIIHSFFIQYISPLSLPDTITTSVLSSSEKVMNLSDTRRSAMALSPSGVPVRGIIAEKNGWKNGSYG